MTYIDFSHHDSELSAGTPPEPAQLASEAAPRWRSRILPVVLRVSALLIGVGAGAALFYLPVFAVSQVSVTGARHIVESDVIASLSLVGDNLLSLPVEDLRATLQEEPWVRDAELRRSLPGHVTIVLEERSPSAVWQVGSQSYWVDRDGTVLQVLAQLDRSLPLIKDMSGPDLWPGQKVDPDAVSLALTLTERLPQEMRDEAVFFEYLSYAGIVVETQKGYRARFGVSEDLDWKLAVWRSVIETGESKDLKVGHVDLRFGDRPFFRP